MAAAIGWGCVQGPFYGSNNNNNNTTKEKGHFRCPPTRCSGNGSQRRIASVKRSPKIVFQDDMKGIVCYRNENGEIVCEGPDEGPHFHPNISKRQSMPVQLYSLLHASYVRPYLLLEGVDFK